MKPKPPKAGSKEWYAYYSARIDELAFSMDLQFIEASNAKIYGKKRWESIAHLYHWPWTVFTSVPSYQATV